MGNPPPTTPNSQASLNPIQSYAPKPAQPKPTLGLAKLSKIFHTHYLGFALASFLNDISTKFLIILSRFLELACMINH